MDFVPVKRFGLLQRAIPTVPEGHMVVVVFKNPETTMTLDFAAHHYRGPTARPHTSLGRSPRSGIGAKRRAEGPIHYRNRNVVRRTGHAWNDDGAGLQPLFRRGLTHTWGFAPGWYETRRWRLSVAYTTKRGSFNYRTLGIS